LALFKFLMYNKVNDVMSVIEIKNLTKHFGSVNVVDDVSFAVEQGEIFGFLGPNGAGKTTTIRCMMDFIRPTAGQVMILGKDSLNDTEELKKEIGYLAGSVRAYDNWTGQQHINFALSLNGKKNIASNLATRLQFNPKVKTKNLSSGNRQKLGVILAFMFEPKVAILDEPTNALDPLMQNIIYDIIREQTYKGATVFMSSHNLAEVERVCSRVGIIRQGKMVAVESMESLKEKQMHRVKVVFAGKYDKGEFLTLGGSEVVMASPEELILNVRGEIASILRVLSAHRMKNLEIGRASLEDIFMEYYER